MSTVRTSARAAIAFVLVAAMAWIASEADADGLGRYQQRNLVTDVTDGSITAEHVDPNLVNA